MQGTKAVYGNYFYNYVHLEAIKKKEKKNIMEKANII